MCEDVLGVVMVIGMRLEVEVQMWGGTGTDTAHGYGHRAQAKAQTGAVHSDAPALLHTHCCAEPCSGGNQRIEQ